MSGIRFTDGINNNPTMEIGGLTTVVPGGQYDAYAASGNTAGCRPVFTAAATLTANDSGALCIFNLAAGFTYTLPAAQKGLHFKFIVQTTATSVVHRVACATGDFFLGSILQSTDGTFVTAPHDANGTTHLAWEGDGSTTGGIKGDWLEVTGISSTQWAVSGYNQATGTEATPWKTS